jgi:DNA polymerase elongation subunit (family B)
MLENKLGDFIDTNKIVNLDFINLYPNIIKKFNIIAITREIKISKIIKRLNEKNQIQNNQNS